MLLSFQLNNYIKNKIKNFMENQKMLSLVLYSMKLFAGISSDDPKIIISEFEESQRILNRDALAMFPILYLAWMNNQQDKSDYILELFPFSIRYDKHQKRNVLVSVAFETFLEKLLMLASPDSNICRFEIPENFKLDEALSVPAKSVKRAIQTPPIEKELPQEMAYWNWLIASTCTDCYNFLFEVDEDSFFGDSTMEISFYCAILYVTRLHHSFSISKQELVSFKERIEELIKLKNENPATSQLRGYFPNGYQVQK